MSAPFWVLVRRPLGLCQISRLSLTRIWYIRSTIIHVLYPYSRIYTLVCPSSLYLDLDPKERSTPARQAFIVDTLSTPAPCSPVYLTARFDLTATRGLSSHR